MSVIATAHPFIHTVDERTSVPICQLPPSVRARRTRAQFGARVTCEKCMELLLALSTEAALTRAPVVHSEDRTQPWPGVMCGNFQMSDSSTDNGEKVTCVECDIAENGSAAL